MMAKSSFETDFGWLFGNGVALNQPDDLAVAVAERNKHARGERARE